MYVINLENKYIISFQLYYTELPLLLLNGIMITFTDIFPIDNFPNLLQVIRSHIAVLKVIGVFPHINAQQRNQSGSGLKRILIGSGSELDSFGDWIKSLKSRTKQNRIEQWNAMECNAEQNKTEQN